MHTFKALSALLSYPTAELCAARNEIRRVIEEEAVLPAADRRALDRLIDGLGDGDLLDLQERYVSLFDRTRSLSLHLFEHVHGESRDRGQAMIDLQDLYKTHELEVAANELPDYLPLFLEFLSMRSLDDARGLLGQPLGILIAVRERLEKRESPYAAVFRALERLADGKPSAEDLEALRAEADDDPNDTVALDRAWEEEAVTFGPDESAGCPKASAMLDRIGAGRD